MNLCNRYSSYYRQTAGYCNPLLRTVYLTCDTTALKSKNKIVLTGNLIFEIESVDESCPENYKIRLVNKKETETSIEGRVEICHSNTWTPFCKYIYGFYSGYYYYYNSAQIGALLCNSLDDSRVATNCKLQCKHNAYLSVCE